MNDTIRGPKKRGRPPKQGIALTPAQRQAAYRERLAKAMGNADVDPGAASTVALLASLKQHCQSIDSTPDHADIARQLAVPLIRELCDRYKISLTPQ